MLKLGNKFRRSFVFRNEDHLFAQIIDDQLVLAVIPDSWGLFLVPVADLLLQFCVGGLQRAHLVQVGRQAVVQVLHGDFLLAREDGTAARAASTARRVPGQVEPGTDVAGGVGHLRAPDPGHAHGPSGAAARRQGRE